MEPVLRPEQRRQGGPRQTGDTLRHVREGAVDRRGIGDQPDPRPVEQSGFEQAFGTEGYGHRQAARSGMLVIAYSMIAPRRAAAELMALRAATLCARMPTRSASRFSSYNSATSGAVELLSRT